MGGQKYVHADEAAKYLGLSRQTLYAKCRAREIPFYALSKSNYLFLLSELDEYIGAHRVSAEDVLSKAADSLLAKMEKRGRR